MPILVQGKSPLISEAEVQSLWRETLAYTQSKDQDVTIGFVTEEEMQRLNREHRGKDMPTNVLTFSYGDNVHDLAICLAVIEREATERVMAERDYLALVLVHGFLHVVGMDHEQSPAAATTTNQAEQAILEHCGFPATHL